ncbi:hypothetical protein [Scopulibacillus cellulosilyticus]|uniref:Uncharacterized protein n=1 Tax=Scopulibacillus cellulosilyticus TaxID=2665665 RepID=A0ABW2PVC7_9BACL
MTSIIITIIVLIIASAFTQKMKDKNDNKKKTIKKTQTTYRSNSNKYKHQHHKQITSKQKPKPKPSGNRQQQKKKALKHPANDNKLNSVRPVYLKEHGGESSHHSKAPIISKQSFADAFILSECLDKPRAFRPHPSIQKYQKIRSNNLTTESIMMSDSNVNRQTEK